MAAYWQPRSEGAPGRGPARVARGPSAAPRGPARSAGGGCTAHPTTRREHRSRTTASVHTRAPIGAPAGGMDRPDAYLQPVVAPLPPARPPVDSGVVAARTHLQHATQALHGVVGFLRMHTREPHVFSLRRRPRQVQSVNATAVAVYQLAWHIPASCVDVS